jgi:predicted AlkP superfamily phosphohydrolase/phosphomutase
MTTHGGNPPGRMTVTSVEVLEQEDWSRTKAYPQGTGGIVGTQRISLNVRGREPEGIVEPGEEYDGLCRRISGELLALRDESGRRLIAAVHRREELYVGPYAHEASDLLAVFEEGIGGTGRDAGDLALGLEGILAVPVTDRMSGSHRPEGILIAHGRQIVCARTLCARVVDVFSTVLHVLGVPAPPDTDGRVLSEMLTADHRASLPATHAGAEGREPTIHQQNGTYTEQDRHRVEERLRKLGYLD